MGLKLPCCGWGRSTQDPMGLELPLGASLHLVLLSKKASVELLSVTSRVNDHGDGKLFLRSRDMLGCCWNELVTPSWAIPWGGGSLTWCRIAVNGRSDTLRRVCLGLAPPSSP